MRSCCGSSTLSMPSFSKCPSPAGSGRLRALLPGLAPALSSALASARLPLERAADFTARIARAPRAAARVLSAACSETSFSLRARHTPGASTPATPTPAASSSSTSLDSHLVLPVCISPVKKNSIRALLAAAPLHRARVHAPRPRSSGTFRKRRFPALARARTPHLLLRIMALPATIRQAAMRKRRPR